MTGFGPASLTSQGTTAPDRCQADGMLSFERSDHFWNAARRLPGDR
jgi:hypothetical protein